MSSLLCEHQAPALSPRLRSHSDLVEVTVDKLFSSTLQQEHLGLSRRCCSTGHFHMPCAEHHHTKKHRALPVCRLHAPPVVYMATVQRSLKLMTTLAGCLSTDANTGLAGMERCKRALPALESWRSVHCTRFMCTCHTTIVLLCPPCRLA
jgi:hypothetical protein